MGRFEGKMELTGPTGMEDDRLRGKEEEEEDLGGREGRGPWDAEEALLMS